MKIHREGNFIISLALFISVIIALVVYSLVPFLLLKLIYMLPVIVLLFLVIWFFRVPSRTLPADDNRVIAPADGKIVVIEKTTEEEYFKDERIQISIFMSPLNVHQNVYPVAGEVSYTKYHKGKYLVAWHPKSSAENERSTVVVKTNRGSEVLFRQIAGAVARRICLYAKIGDNAVKGQEFGFIKFGSRVDIFLPLDSKILCKVGDVSRNKETVIAELA
jgi:phosphatidylserine decarboxylase